jgi:hypothetical protein
MPYFYTDGGIRKSCSRIRQTVQVKAKLAIARYNSAESSQGIIAYNIFG